MVNPVAGSFAERVPLLVLSGGPGDEERKLGHADPPPGEGDRVAAPHLSRGHLRRARCSTTRARRPSASTTSCARSGASSGPGYLEIHRDMVERRIPVPREIVEWDGALHFARSDDANVAEAVRDTAARWNARAAAGGDASASRRYRYQLGREVRAAGREDRRAGRDDDALEGRVPDGPPAVPGRPHGRDLAAGDPRAGRARRPGAQPGRACGRTWTRASATRRRCARPLDLGRRRPRRRELPQLHATSSIRDFVRGLLRARLRRHRERVRYHDNLPRETRRRERRRRSQVTRTSCAR